MSKYARDYNLGLRVHYASLMFDVARCHDAIPLISPQGYEEIGREIIRLYRTYEENKM